MQLLTKHTIVGGLVLYNMPSLVQKLANELFILTIYAQTQRFQTHHSVSYFSCRLLRLVLLLGAALLGPCEEAPPPAAVGEVGVTVSLPPFSSRSNNSKMCFFRVSMLLGSCGKGINKQMNNVKQNICIKNTIIIPSKYAAGIHVAQINVHSTNTTHLPPK